MVSGIQTNNAFQVRVDYSRFTCCMSTSSNQHNDTAIFIPSFILGLNVSQCLIYQSIHFIRPLSMSGMTNKRISRQNKQTSKQTGRKNRISVTAIPLSHYSQALSLACSSVGRWSPLHNYSTSQRSSVTSTTIAVNDTYFFKPVQIHYCS